MEGDPGQRYWRRAQEAAGAADPYGLGVVPVDPQELSAPAGDEGNADTAPSATKSNLSEGDKGNESAAFSLYPSPHGVRVVDPVTGAWLGGRLVLGEMPGPDANEVVE